jgi:hypothetical protein
MMHNFQNVYSNQYFFSDGIEYLRIIRDPTPNQYMCLIKFKSQVRTIID